MTAAKPSALQLYTIDEVAAQLLVSRRWLQDFIKINPFYKIAGRRKVFSPSDIRLLHEALYLPKRELSGKPPRKLRAEDVIVRLRQDTPGFVYIAGNSKLVKIGFTTNVTNRMASLQTGNHEHIELLCVIPGTQREEARLHAQFGHLRRIGEWFYRVDDLSKYITANKS